MPLAKCGKSDTVRQTRVLPLGWPPPIAARSTPAPLLQWNLSGAYCVWSAKTLHKAKRELLESGLIAVSRQGGKNQCTLYALTFLAIDDCGGKLDIGETSRAPDDWKRRHYELNPIPSLKQH